MVAKTLTKENFKEFAENLIKSGKVVGVKRKESKFAFGELENADELVLDFDVTLRSPRYLFQPPKEKLFDFELGNKVEVKGSCEEEPFVLIGVHTYDMKAINQMDKIWAEDNPDGHYATRREASTIIALEPTKASKWSFWASMDSANVKEGYDLLLTDIGDKYIIEIGTEKGTELLSKHASSAADATDEDLAKRDKARDNMSKLCAADRDTKVKGKDITKLVTDNYNNEIWEKQAEKCYSCGSCNLVCPTCYCFDVKDNIELDLKHGQRSRRWDGCLLEAFAEVGTGENFREKRADRFRHRILRKMKYVPETKLEGELACVGCGRCSSACLPDITDPVKIINELKG